MFLPSEQLLHRIQTLLDDEHAALDGERLAHEFARRWNGACQRLEECDKLLEYGDDYTALQIAETPPTLLNQLDQLSFARLDAWSDLCRRKNWPVPGHRINRSAIGRLEALYEKPVRGNHPLFRKLQGAMLRKDFRHALSYLRQLDKENAGDRTIRDQRILFEKKILAMEEQILADLLEKNHPRQAIDRLNHLEGESWCIPLESDVLADVRHRRAEWEKEKALRQQDSCWEDLMTAVEGGDINILRTAVNTLQDFQRRSGTSLSENEENRLAEIIASLEKQEEERAFLHEGEHLLAEWEKALEEEPPRAAELAHHQAAVEDWRSERNRRIGEDPADPDNWPDRAWEERRKAAEKTMGHRTRQIRKGRRRRTSAILAGGLALTFLAAFFLFQRVQEQRYFTQFDAVLEGGDGPSVEQFLGERPPPRRVRANPLWDERRGRADALIARQSEAVRQWKARQAETEQLLEDEAMIEETPLINRLLGEMDTLLEALPPSERTRREREREILQEDFLRRTAAQREAFLRQVEQQLHRLENPPVNTATETDPETVAQSIATMETLRRESERMRDTAERPFPIPPEWDRRLEEALARRATETEAFHTYQENIRFLRRNTQPAIHQETLTRLANLPFLFPDLEAIRNLEARRHLLNDPLDSLFADFILLPPEALPAAADWLLPNPAQPAEEEILRRLQESLERANLETIVRYQAVESDGRAVRRYPIYVRGEVRTESFTVGREFESFYFTPLTLQSEEPVVWQRERLIRTDGSAGPWEGRWLTEPSRIAEPATAQQLRLLLDRRTGRISEPLLPRLDAIHRDPEISPLFKLFIDVTFEEIFQVRPRAWGMDFAIEYDRHRREVREVLGAHRPSARDWLFPTQFERLANAAADLYANRRESFAERASLRYTMNRLLPRQDLDLVGFFDERGRFHLVQEPRSRLIIALPEHRPVYRWITREDLETSARPGQWVPYAPVLTLRASLPTLLEEIARESGSTVEAVRAFWASIAPLPSVP